jgi:hypothetical protein
VQGRVVEILVCSSCFVGEWSKVLDLTNLIASLLTNLYSID